MSKIIIVGPASPLRGGISDFNEALAKSLIDKGNDVEIVSFSLQYPKILFPGKTQKRVYIDSTISYKILATINSINPLSWIKSANYIKSFQPDIVFIRFWMPFFAPCLGVIASILRKNKLKVFGIVDNAIAHEKRLLDNQLVNFFLKKCKSHVTLSQKVKEDILSINSKAIVKALFHPIYNTYKPLVDRKKALEVLNMEDGKYVLFFGLVRKYKGLDLIINAMADENIQKKDIKLIVAGEFYETEEKYQKIIKELNLKNIIIHNEFIGDDKVPYFFSVSNLVVLPYKSATQSGVSQLAMHYNKPMLATNVGGLSECITHEKDGYIASADYRQLSRYIIEYFSNDKNEDEMSKALSLKKKDYSWNSFTDEILKL
jgi:glycosyltransferase involved in cell wall biosynthesis